MCLASPVMRPVLSSQGYRVPPFRRRRPNLPGRHQRRTLRRPQRCLLRIGLRLISKFSRVDSLPHFTSPAMTVCRVARSRSSFDGRSDWTCGGLRLLFKSARRTLPALSTALPRLTHCRPPLLLVLLTHEHFSLSQYSLRLCYEQSTYPRFHRPFGRTLDRQESHQDVCVVVFLVFSWAHV